MIATRRPALDRPAPADTGGLPALVVASPEALTDRVRRKLAGLAAETAVARVLALGLRLDDAALASASASAPVSSSGGRSGRSRAASGTTP